MGACANPMFLLVDNSDSPSVVEQLQQGHGSDCYTFIRDHFWLYDVSYALCLSASFLQHGYIQVCFLFLFCDLIFPCPLFSFLISTLSPPLLAFLGSAATFIQGVFSLNPGVACLAF